MTTAQASITITVPWWVYGAYATAVLALVAASYAAGRLDRRNARDAAAVDREFAPTLDRWRTIDRQATGRHAAAEQDQAGAEGAPASPINGTKPGWASAVEAWGQPRQPAGYPQPPALTAEPDPRAAESTVGRAQVAGVAPLDFGEQISALNAALGGPVRWAADAEETGWIPAVQA